MHAKKRERAQLVVSFCCFRRPDHEGRRAVLRLEACSFFLLFRGLITGDELYYYLIGIARELMTCSFFLLFQSNVVRQDAGLHSHSLVVSFCCFDVAVRHTDDDATARSL